MQGTMPGDKLPVPLPNQIAAVESPSEKSTLAHFVDRAFKVLA